MSECVHCGAPVPADQASCAACGQPVAPATQAEGQPGGPTVPPTLPPPPPQQSAAAPPTFDFTKLIRGNWLAALATALVATVVAVGVCATLIFLADPPETSRSDQVAFSVSAAAASFTGDTGFSVESRGEAEQFEFSGSGGTVPLFVSILAIGAAAWVFHRATRGYPGVGAVLGDAARAAVLFGILMLVVCLFGQRENGLFADLLDIPESERSDIGWGASIATTTFLSMTILFVALVIVSLVPRARLAPRLLRVRDILAPGVYGVTAFTLLLPLAGLVGYLAGFSTDGEPFPGDDFEEDGGDDLTDVITLLIGAVGNAGMLFLTIGAGGRLGEHHDLTEFDDDKGSEWHRLAWLADEGDVWGLWLSIPTLLLVLAACAFLVLRSSRRLDVVGPGLMVWALLMFAAVPALSRWASLHGEMRAAGDGERLRADGYGGIRPVDSLLIPAIALALALLLAALFGAFRGLGAMLAWTPNQAGAGSGPTSGPAAPAPAGSPGAAAHPGPPPTSPGSEA